MAEKKPISMGLLHLTNILIGFCIGLINLGVAPILATISGIYPEASKAAVQGLMTTPSYLALVFGLLAGILTTKFSIKKLLNVALLEFAIVGLIPLFVQNFAVLNVCRILSGFAAGMIVPISVTFIMTYYDADKKSTALGIQTGSVTGSMMIINIVGGRLAVSSYNYFFILYLVVVATLACCVFILPDLGPIKGEKKSGGIKQYFTWQSLLFAIFPGLFWIGYTAYNSNIAFYVAQYFSGNSATTGTISAIANLLSAIAGFLFGFFHKKFKDSLTGICMIGLALGYAVLSFATSSFVLVVVAQCLIGFFMANIISHSRMCASSMVLPAGITLVNGMCTIFINIFKLTANQMVNGVTAAIYGNSDPAPVFMVSAVLTAVFGVLWLLYVAFIKKHPVRIDEDTTLTLPMSK